MVEHLCWTAIFPSSVWFLVGNGGMDIGDYWGLYRGFSFFSGLELGELG